MLQLNLVSVLLNNSVECKQMYYGNLASFEYAALQFVMSNCIPDHLQVTKIPLLSNICIDFDHIVTVGDFNIHFDNLRTVVLCVF